MAWRIPFLAATAIALGAAALRARGLFADLWLDEIWSLNGAFGVRSWWDIFTRLTIDNNHHLNTLYLLLIGDGASAVQYRLLAFVTGVLAVLVAAVIAAREGRASAVVAALLFGSSYLLVFYSSEARGYAPVVLFGLVAWLVVLRHAEAPSTAAVIALSACTLAGVMAHRSYGFFLVGAYVWFDFHQQRRSKIRAATRLSLRTFAVPLALVLAFAVIAFRNTTVGGGPAYRLHTIIAQTLSSLGSGPAHGWAMWLMAALVAVLFAAALIDRWHARDDRWVLYLTSVVLIPAVLGIAQPSVLTPRYFIVPAAFALLAISIWLGRAIERGGIARLVAVAATLTLVGAGLERAFDGRAFDRGHYQIVVAEMLSGAGSGMTTVASSDRFGGHDFRTRMVVDYYVRAAGGPPRLTYVDEASYPTAGTDWIIVESLDARPGEPEFRDRFGHVFRLASEYPTGELSGITWRLYRRVTS